ncbi:MAG: TolC family protein [Owenweeksia sp.]
MNFNSIASTVACLSVLTFSTVKAQDKVWTLDECAAYAVQNNIQVQQSNIDKKIALSNRETRWAGLAPSLNASSSYYWNFGLNVDPVTNIISEETRRTANFGLSGNWVLYNGGQNWNSIKQSNLDYLAQTYTQQDIENDINLNVASAFLQILLNKEIRLVAQEQKRITELQASRMQQLVDAGARPKGDLLQLQSQLARDNQNLIAAENQVTISKLQLANLMQLEDPQNLRVADPQIALPGTEYMARQPDIIYETALGNQADIKSAETTVLSSEENVDVALSGYLPTLSLGFGIGTNYSSQVERVFNQDFSTQLDNNLNKYIGFNLNVPIFSRFQTRNQYQTAKLNFERARLNLELSKNNLKQTVYQAHADAKAAYNSYLAAEKAVEANEESFKYAQQRYDVGALSQFDYENAKNSLASAKSEMVRAKYDYIFKVKVLEFYLTNQVKL